MNFSWAFWLSLCIMASSPAVSSNTSSIGTDLNAYSQIIFIYYPMSNNLQAKNLKFSRREKFVVLLLSLRLEYEFIQVYFISS